MRVTSFGLGLLLVLTGCAGGDPDPGPIPVPTPLIQDISTFTAEVGEQVEFYGQGFIDPTLGWVDVVFEGTFTPDDGSPAEPVNLVIPFQGGSDTIRWDSFGAYRVPFIPSGDRVGTFEGELYAINQTFTGESYPQPAEQRMPLTFTVLPSLIIQDFLAVGDTWIADCRFPALNALNVIPYAVRVRAIGFDPLNFQYSFSEGLMIDGVVQDATTMIREVTEIGQTEHSVLTRWGPVPENNDGYRASISIASEGSDGIRREVRHTFMVRNPLQIYFRGPMQIAELYQPEPVSACIPGGPGGVRVSYTETTTETRTRQIQRQVDRGWERSYGMEHGETYNTSATMGEANTASTMVTQTDATTMSQDESMTDMFSRTDGRTRETSVDFSETASEEWGWNVQTETVEDYLGEIGGMVTTAGEVGVPLVANGSVSVTAQGKRGWVDGTRMREGMTGEMGMSSTVGFGEREGLSEQEERALSRARGYHWGVSQTYAEANGYSHSNTWSQTQAFGESLSTSMSIGERYGESESELLSVSTSESEALSFEAEVFAGQFGTWYRQTARMIRFGSVVAYDLCGNGSEVGQIALDDWTWAPDLGIGAECPPMTNLPPAECRISPCSGF